MQKWPVVIEQHQTQPAIYVLFMCELDHKCKIVFKKNY